MQPVRVLVVDDHQVFADALSVRLRAEPDIEVVATAGSVEKAAATVERLDPDVIVLDVDLGGDSGLDLARNLTADRPDLGIVVLTCHDDVDAASAAFRAGAAAFVSKAAPGEELLGAIHRVARGESWLPQHLLRGVLRRLGAGPEPMSPDEAAIAKLTAREREILSLMVAGCDRSTIARKLFLSPNTVRTHAQNMLGKLGVQSSLEAVGIALRAGLRPPETTGAVSH